MRFVEEHARTGNLEDLRLDLRLCSVNKCHQVKTGVSPHEQEGAHVELRRSDEVSLSDIDHLAKLAYTAPSSVQKLSREGVQSHVDALATGLAQNALHKTGVARVEDALSWETETFDQVLHLFFISDGSVDFGANHQGDLHSSDPNAAASAVDENRLI